MPYIELKTTAKVSDSQADSIKTAFGKAIECFPGKTERWLMVSIEGDKKMWFAGDNGSDSAMVDVSLLGNVDASASEKMTAKLCRIIEEELGVSQDRTYVKYSGYANWGWNGSNF